MQKDYEQDQIEASYLSSLLYKKAQVIHTICNSHKEPSQNLTRKQRMSRTKTHLYFIQDPHREHIDQLKRKNSLSTGKNFRKIEHFSLEPKFTPYQNRKNQEKVIFNVKRERIRSKIDKLPTKLQESKDNWLIVKEVISTKNPNQHSQTSSERIKIDISDLICDEEPIIHKQATLESNRNKCMKNMLSYYKNKHVIKHNLQTNKHLKLTNSSVKEEIGLKLSNLTQIKNSLKIKGLKDKIKNVFTTKRRNAQKVKKDIDENAIFTQNLRINLRTSTHSDHTEKTYNNILEGVLNSFKVDMKVKQRTRPKTAERLFKSDQSPSKLLRQNVSSKMIEMTGWQNQPDKFERDIFFS